jgi:hypothetical protein
MAMEGVTTVVAAMAIDGAEEGDVMIVAVEAGPVLETAAGDKHKHCSFCTRYTRSTI